MTYDSLLRELQALTPKQLQQEVIVYAPDAIGILTIIDSGMTTIYDNDTVRSTEQYYLTVG